MTINLNLLSDERREIREKDKDGSEETSRKDRPVQSEKLMVDELKQAYPTHGARYITKIE